jgi:hypothetical protein
MGIYSALTKEEKIRCLVMMNKENDLTFSPVEGDPDIFDLNEVYHKSNNSRKKFLEESRSFESGNRPPKYSWEKDTNIKFIPKESITTRKEAEAFLESVGSDRDDAIKTY